MSNNRFDIELVNLDDLVQIDRICEEVENSWTQNLIEMLDGRIREVPQSLRANLLKELLLTDIEKRNASGCLKPRDFYLQHLPDFEQEIDAATRSAIELGVLPQFNLRIGRYEIQSQLGKGGMGKVFQAFDTELKRRVAIKTLLPNSSKNPQRLSRFQHEMRSHAALSHQNIVTLFDVVHQNDELFAIMELMDGEDLSKCLRRTKKLEVETSLRIARDVAEGLSAAHEHGIVHRDIKPANIFICNDGSAKILDFGIAMLREISEPNSDPKSQESSAIVGTYDYMSPEQMRGESTDARSDIFAAGTVLYEMITGRKPFKKSTLSQTKSAVQHDAVEFEESDKLGNAVKKLLRRCLEKNPDDRFQTATELTAAIELLLRRSNRGKASQAAAVIIGTVLLFSAAFLSGSLSWTEPTRPAVERQKSLVESIAVLPFLGNIPEDYIKDGLTFSITNSLSQVEELNVRPFSVVNRLGSCKNKSTQELADRLKVDGLISGYANLTDDEKVLIHVELVDTKTNQSIWGADYVEPVQAVMEVQNKVLTDLGQFLGVAVSADSVLAGGKSTRNMAAYEQYIRGQVALSQRKPDSVKRALNNFQKAVDEDPRFDLAYVGLAECLIVQSERNVVDPNVGYRLAKQYAERALQLNPQLTNAKISLAMIEFEFEWDFEAAERSFKEALKVSKTTPGINHPTGHQWYAEFLSAMGRHREAKQEIEIAIQQNPSSNIVQTVKGLIYLKAGESSKAIELLKTLLVKNPDFDRARGYLIDAYELQKDFDSALLQWTLLAKSEQTAVEHLRNAFRENGERGYWQKRLELRKELCGIRAVSPAFLANVYYQNQMESKAIQLIRGCAERKDGALAPNLLVHPSFNGLRDQKEFASIVKLVGYPEN